MAPVVFAHANGYPPGAYRCLLTALESGLGAPIATHEHRPLVTDDASPQFLSWQTYASDLIERIETDANAPVWLMGHSMGAASGVLAAARRPELFLGIIALDPVIIPDKIWFWSLIFNRLKPNGMPIIRRAMGRPHQFGSHEEAFDFYRAKRVFSSVRDEVLMDYVLAGHVENAAGSVSLRHSGAWEACIYRSVPRMKPSLRALKCPMHIIAGASSDVLNEKNLAEVESLNERITSQALPGGHLLPLESPELCAEAVTRFLVEHGRGGS